MKTKIDINRKDIRHYTIVLVVGLVLGWVFFYNPDRINNVEHDHMEHTEVVTTWTCSMHPQIRQDKPGQCPICAMDLIPLESNNVDAEGIDPNEIQMSNAAIKLAQIQTVTVMKGYSDKEVYLLGKVKPDERNIAEITARFGGRIEKLFVDFKGRSVKKGEKLAIIYSPILISAQKELLESIEYKASNPALYRASKNKLMLWGVSEAQINGIEKKGEVQNYFDVLSPMSGIVTKRHVSNGDYIKEGNPLFQVIDLKKVWVMFEAYESDLPWLHKGDEVKFTVQSMPGEVFDGKVTYIDPFLNAETRIANVRVEVENPNLELKPEMYVDGIIKSKTLARQKELMVPKTSVLWTGKRAVVYVRLPKREHSSFVYREIVLGADAGAFYLVKDGLKEGEEIAVNGVFKIDAAAQLEGKSSMMNPTATGGIVSVKHSHEAMDKGGEMEADHSNSTQVEANVEHVRFNVSGNCGMCEETIETAVKMLSGIRVADWSQETKQMYVSFNKEMVTLDKIHKAIAAVGYDTDKLKGDDDAYSKLPECCRYTK